MTPTKTGNGIVIRPSREELETRVANRFADLIANAPVEDEGEGSARMLDRLLNVTDIESLAAMFSGMDSSKDVIDVPLMIHGFVLRMSDYEGGLGRYATVFANRRDTGEEVTFNSGAMTVVGTLLVAQDRNWFPLTGHIAEKRVKSGNTAYNLILDA